MKTKNPGTVRARRPKRKTRNRNRSITSSPDSVVVLSTVVKPSPRELDIGWRDIQRHEARHRRYIAPPAIAPRGNRSPAYLMAKRALDIAGAVFLLTLFSPLLATVWIVLCITTKGHPIFAQERVGFLGRPFRLYKFRTMLLDAEKLRDQVQNQQKGPIFKNHEDPRITRFGKLLRRTSVDEMPQLINILKGDMSLVGPRPPLAQEVALYRPPHRIRLTVKPGLTCLWQVSGRSEIEFDRWMVMDSWYVRHQSVAMDLALLLRTPWAVLSRRGAY